MSKKTIVNSIKITASLLLVGWLILSMDWGSVFDYLLGADFRLIILFIVIHLLGIAISSYKWKLLALYKKFNNSYSFFFKTYLSGMFLNNFLPSFVGGDSYRSWALGKREKRLHSSAGVVVFDRGSGLLSAILLGAGFSFLNLSVMEEFSFWSLFIWIATIVVILVFSAAYFYPTKFIQKTIGFFPKVFRQHFSELAEYRNWKIVFLALSWSSIFSFVGVAIANYVLFMAVGVSINPMDYLSVIFFISIIASVPISVGNIGVKEWAYVVFFGLFGISASVAIAVVILNRVAQALVSLIALPFYLHDNIDLKKTKSK